jgi:hypothetical protein
LDMLPTPSSAPLIFSWPFEVKCSISPNTFKRDDRGRRGCLQNTDQYDGNSHLCNQFYQLIYWWTTNYCF